LVSCTQFKQDPSKNPRNFTIKSDLRGHTGAVYTCQWSRCGKFLASGGFDKTIRIWDPFSLPNKELQTLVGHSLNISDVDWTLDSTEIVSGSYDQTVKTWDVEGGKMKLSIDLEGFVQCVSFNPKSNS
jgi:COMPASS component SWD3